MPGAQLTMVEGDTLLDLTAVLTDAYENINLADASSVILTMNGDTHELTPLPAVGNCTWTMPAAMTANPGFFPAEIIVTLDGNAWYFPSENPIRVEVLPHTRTRA